MGLHEVFEYIDIPFIYVSLVHDVTNTNDYYLNYGGVLYVPSNYYDGGVFTHIGRMYVDSILIAIDSCQVRPTPGYAFTVDLLHQGGDIYEIQVHLRTDNLRPQLTGVASGPTSGNSGEEFSFSITGGEDPEGSALMYRFDWGDGTYSEWLGPYNDGDTCIASHIWNDGGNFEVKAHARDDWFHETSWSAPLSISINKLLICGDVNDDNTINIIDVIFLIEYLYLGGDPPEEPTTADVNNDSHINILDILNLISYIYGTGVVLDCP